MSNWKRVGAGLLCAAAFLLQSLLANIFPTRAAVESSYRWRNDNGTESTATYTVAQNTAVTSVPLNTTERVRFAMANSGSETEFLRNAATTSATGNNIFDVAVDTVNGYAYYITNETPSKILKLRTSDMVEVASLTLASGDVPNNISTFVLDTANGYGYYGTAGTPAKIVKINLGAGNAAPTRTAVLTLNSGENDIDSAVIDAANGYGYFATNTTPGRIVKVLLGAGAAAPTRTAAVTLNSGENSLASGVINTSTGYGYFGTNTLPGIVVKVLLGAGAAAPTRTAAVTLNSGEQQLYSAAIDTVNGFAYFGTAVTTAKVIKVALGAGAAAPTRSAVLTLNSGDDSLYSMSPDLNNGYIYTGTVTSPARLIRISIAPHYSFRMEFGKKVSTCAAIASWTQVASATTTAAWAMSDSANLTDGAVTTNSAGVTDPNTNFRAGYVKDLSSDASSTSLGETQFTEMEYSVQATALAASTANYCFRLTNAGTALATYTNYAEAQTATVNADLSVTNTVDNAAPNVGNTVTYTVIVSNAGPNQANNVAVTDLLPSGLTFVSATPSQGSYVSGTGVWTVGTMTNGSSKTLTISATVNTGFDGATITNTAQVSASDEADPDSTPNNSNAGEDDQASRNITVNAIAPTLTRSIPFTTSTGYTQQDSTKTKFLNGAVQLGTDSTVGGVSSVSSVVSSSAYSTVSDALSVPATGVITSWRVYSVNNTTLSLKAYLRNGANNYTARAESSAQSVNATSVNGPFSTSMSVVSGDKIGLFGANNPLSAVGNGNTFLWNAGDFSGTGSFSNFDSAHSQPNIEFTLTQFNTAQDWYLTTTDTTHVKTRTWTAVNGVTITQTTPGSTSIKYLVSFDGRTSWKYWTGSAWAVSTLANIQTDGNSQATLQGLSSANWASSGGFVSGTTVGIDVAVDLKSTSNTVTPSVDNIAFSYTAPTDNSVNYLTANEANYTQQDAANGTDFANGAVTLHLGSGSTLYSLSGGSGGTSGLTTYTAPDGTTVVSSVPTWNNGSLYYMQYLFDGSGLAGTPTDTQIWLGQGPSCSTGTPCTMLITLPALTSLDHLIVYPYARSADWSEYSIAVSPDNTNWTFLSGAGSGSASTGIGTSFTHTSQGSPGDNFTYSSIGSYKYIKFSLTRQGTNGPALDEIQIYKATAAYPLNTGYYVTTKTASHINTTGWTAMGGVYTTETTPTSTTLKYLVSFDNGTTWKYWTGSAWATSAIGSIGTNGMSKTTLEGLAWDDWQSTAGVGGFVPGTTTSLDFAAELKTADNSVTPTLDQISVEYSTVAYNPSADLSVGKTVNNAAPHVGDSITYTVSATNSGPNSTTNVAITDLLPSGLTYVSSTPSQGSYVNGTGVWTVGSMISSGTASMQIVATVNAGTGGTTATNTAEVTASDQTDPDSTPNNHNAAEDDQASAVIHVVTQSADLSLTKSVNAPTANVGQNVTFTVNVTNSGPDSATGVSVKDLLPSGLTYVSSTPSQGSYASATGTWTVGTIANGATKTLSLTASVDAGTGGTVLTNTAQVLASDLADPDSTPNNSNATEDDQASATVTVQSADLSLTKSVNAPTANVGQNVTFTVNVTNGGPNTATNVSVKDLLPSGLTYVSSSPSQGSYASSTGTWTVGSITNGATKSLTVTASVDAGTGGSTLTNTAQVLASDQGDPDSTPNNNNAGEDDQASATVAVQSADLSLTKTVNAPTSDVGQNVTFTVSVTNGGPNSATGVQVKDLLPAGLTYVSSSPSQGSYASSTGTWTIGTIANSTTKTLTITATVGAGTGGSTLTNTAQVLASDTSDPDSTPNNSNAGEDDQASVSTTVQSADLSVTKTVDDSTPSEGGTIVYTVTVTNGGPSAATGVAVQDLLPSAVTYVSSTPSQGSYASSTGTWTIGTIANGASKTLYITATVNSGTAGTTATNTAQVFASDTSDPDSTPNNSVASEDDQASRAITVAAVSQSDLSLTKTVDEATPSVGDTVIYTVTVTNSGPTDATGVVVKDLLPSGVTYVSNTPSQGSYASGTGLWTVGAISNGASKTLAIHATVNTGTSGQMIDNVAQVSAADQPDPDSTPNNSVASEDDEADASIIPNAVANDTSRISVSDSEAQGGAGSGADAEGLSISSDGNLVAFTSTATNLVSGDTNGVQDIFVRDRSAGTTVRASVDTSGTQSTASSDKPHLSADGRYVAFASNGNLVAGDTTGLDIFRRDLQTNTTVLASPNANGSANSGGDNPSISSDGRYVAYNTATANITGDTNGLQDVFRRDLTGNTTIRVSLNSSGGQTSNGDSTNPSISRDGRYIAYQSDDTGIVAGDTNAHTDIFVYDVQNNTTVRASLTSTGGQSDGDCTNPSISGNGLFVAFECSATNMVPGDTNGADDIFIRDLQNNTTVRASVATGGAQGTGVSGSTGADAPSLAYDGRFVVFRSGFDNLVTGDTNGKLDIFVHDRTGGTTYRASVASDGTQANSDSNTASAINDDDPITVFSSDASNLVPGDTNGSSDVFMNQFEASDADLSLTKIVDNPTPLIGDTVTYTITVSNAGPLDATNVKVNDILPAGLTYVSHTPSQGNWFHAGGDNNGDWAIGTIPNGSSATLSISATVDAGTGGDTITNTAQVTASDETDPDSSPANSIASEDDQDSASLTVEGSSDLSLTKMVSNNNPLIGQNFTYTITVSNAGPDAATHVTVHDALSGNLNYVSDMPSQGTWFHNGGNNDGDWVIGTIANGGSATLTITANPKGGTGGITITNTAQVKASDQTDIDSTPNNSNAGEDDQASASLTVEGSSDLSVNKTVDNPTPSVGNTIIYTITVSNAGPDAATHVTVNDQLPGGLTYVSDTPSQGTWFHNGGNNDGDWVVGTLNNGASATLSIHATVNTGTGGATITNTAQVTAVDQNDTDSTPNNNNAGEDDQHSASLTVQGTPTTADLSLTKTVDIASPIAGDDIVYTVTVTNHGPLSDSGITVSDLLPSGLTYLSNTASQGSYVSGTGVWTVGSLNLNASATLQIHAHVDTAAQGTTVTNTAEVTAASQPDFDSTPNNHNASEDDQDSVSFDVPAASTNVTLNNSLELSRLKVGVSSVETASFDLQDTLSGTLTVTFDPAFTILSAPTSGTCSGGGTLDTFGFNNATHVMTAVKHQCSGTVTLSGGTVTNPSQPGHYRISWVNDDPGFTIVAITTDDQIFVSAAVNPYITFQVTTDHTGANAACDHGTDGDYGDHTPNTDGGVVQLGLLSSTYVASSDVARVGTAADDGDSSASPVTAGAQIQHICTFTSTNAAGGYALTVKSENGALQSDGTPGDTIPQTPITGAPAAVTMTPGTEHYAMCLSNATGTDPNMDTTTPAGVDLTASGVYASGATGSNTCTGVNTAQTAGELSTQTTQIGSNTGAVQEDSARWLIKSSITAATPAHADYDDTLTFIATGQF